MPEDHTAENIRCTFESLLEEWGTEMIRVVAVTADNGSGVKKGFTEPPVTWTSCFGHNLNPSIGKTMKIDRVEAAIRVCCSVVQGFNHSWKRRGEFKDEQNLPQHSLIQDVVTRWGSTRAKVSRCVERHNAVSAALMAERSPRRLVPEAVRISTCKHLTNCIVQEEDDASWLVKQMKRLVRSDAQERYSGEMWREPWQWQVFLEPRFNGSFVEEVNSVYTTIKREILCTEAFAAVT
ncbi:hypothetical protein SKAU_G00334890 [Synaphobranchus kaupii]|uniref:Uncharacterized protein n=1 Tax=Synaphobranchus kaupii TaxID=118154 RepID=A0A9Q1ELW2_SYNKA|nr:hypothetical protein SKAU_G00334890 [Synaphobranchus kaupii]